MKIVKRILIALAVIIVILLVVAAIMPKTYTVERSLVIKAPKETIMAQVSNFKAWEKWSPWNELDTAMVLTYSDQQGAVGSWYQWKGNDKAGEGKMTIKQLSADMMECDLHFMKPMESTPTNYFKLEPEGDATKVTWGMKGETPFPFNLFFMMFWKGSVEESFDKGLKQMAAIAEASPAIISPETPAATYDVKEGNYEGKSYLAIRKTVKIEDIGKFFGENMPKLMEASQKNQIPMAGNPTGLYFDWNEAKGETDMAVAIPVPANLGKDLGKDIKFISVPASKAVNLDYWGSYDNMMAAHTAIGTYIAQNKLTHMAPVVEETYAGPYTEKDTAKWLTKIYYPVK